MPDITVEGGALRKKHVRGAYFSNHSGGCRSLRSLYKFAQQQETVSAAVPFSSSLCSCDDSDSAAFLQRRYLRAWRHPRAFSVGTARIDTRTSMSEEKSRMKPLGL